MAEMDHLMVLSSHLSTLHSHCLHPQFSPPHPLIPHYLTQAHLQCLPSRCTGLFCQLAILSFQSTIPSLSPPHHLTISPPLSSKYVASRTYDNMNVEQIRWLGFDDESSKVWGCEGASLRLRVYGRNSKRVSIWGQEGKRTRGRSERARINGRDHKRESIWSREGEIQTGQYHKMECRMRCASGGTWTLSSSYIKINGWFSQLRKSSYVCSRWVFWNAGITSWSRWIVLYLNYPITLYLHQPLTFPVHHMVVHLFWLMFFFTGPYVSASHILHLLHVFLHSGS